MTRKPKARDRKMEAKTMKDKIELLLFLEIAPRMGDDDPWNTISIPTAEQTGLNLGGRGS